MFKVKVRDLALVAAAGGLLAFELVSIGEAVPAVKRALAAHTRSAKSLMVAPASAAAVPVAAFEAVVAPESEEASEVAPEAAAEAAAAASEAVAKAVTRHAPRVAVAMASTKTGQCVVVTRSRSANRSRPRVRFVSVKSGSSCSSSQVAVSVERMREVSKAVDLALKHTAL